MLKKRNNYMFIIIVILIFFLLLLTIAYATLSTTLKPKFVGVTQNAMTWNVGLKPGTVTGVASGNTADMSCGSATATATTISGLNITLSKTGDKCSYTFQIQNNGTIGAKISSITPTIPSGSGYTSAKASGATIESYGITYKLRVNSATSNTLLAVGDTIAAKSGSTATLKTVVLTAEAVSGSTDYDFTHTGFGYKINFTQN